MSTVETKVTIDAALIRLRLSGDPMLISVANAMLAFDVIETTRVPTAATDGIVMLFNPDFIASLSMDEAVGIIVHELMHVRLNHNARFKQSVFSNHRIANMAMDDEINPLIEDAGFVLPEGGCYPVDHDSEKGLSWESYYPKRLQQQDEQEDEQDDEQESSSDSSDDEQQGDASDERLSNEAESSSNSSDESDSSQQSSTDAGSNDADAIESVQSGVHESGKLAEEFSPESLESKSPDEAAEQAAEQVEDALADTKLDQAAGTTRSESGSGVIDRSNDEPVILQAAEGERWQDIVIETFRRRSSDSRVDWGRRSRRMQPHSPAYIPARRKVNGLALALVVDVSGSCSSWFGLWQQLANELVEEVDNIERLEIVYHHHRHCFTDTWNKGEGDIELECNEVGGTCHIEALAEVERLDVDAIIQFTDCETQWPSVYPEQDCVTVLPPNSLRWGEACPFGVNIEASVK